MVQERHQSGRGRSTGIFSVEISLGGLQREQWTTADALVDTGSTLSSAPASALRALEVEPMRSASFEFRQGDVRELEVGQAWVRLDGLEIITPVMFNEEGTEPILGAVTLEQFMLGVDPVERRLINLRGRA